MEQNSIYNSTSNILGQLTLNNENVLSRRLYKNFSQSRIEKKTIFPGDSREMSRYPAAEPSFLKGPSILSNSLFKYKNHEESVLVPRIASKLKGQQNSTARQLQIEKGKFVLLQDFSHSSMELTSNRRHLFNKLQTLEHKHSSIFDKEQNPACKLKEKLKKHKGRGTKKGSKIKSYDNHNGVTEKDDDVLTPYDFIKLLTEDPDISDEFCYLRKMSHPYDLRIVDYEKKDREPATKSSSRSETFNRKPILSTVDKGECITISARGITYFTSDESVFVTLKEWQREAELYQKLVNLSFFNNYKIWKNFYSWKKYIRRTAMKKVSERLKNQLLFTDRYIRPTLIYARDLTLMIQNNVKYFKIEQNDKQLRTAQQLKLDQDSYRANELDNNLLVLEDQIKRTVVQTCKTSLRTFKQQHGVTNLEEGEQPQKSIIVGDETHKAMPYTQQATVKTHYKKLNKFVKLIDYMVIAGKLGMVMESTSFLRIKIAEKNTDYNKEVIQTNEKYSYKGKQWFVCQLSFSDEKRLIFEPDRQRLRSIFEEIISKGVSRVCKRHKMICEAPELATFKVQPEEQEQKSEEIFDLQNLLHSNEEFLNQSKELLKQVDISFNYVQRYSLRLKEFLDIYFKNINENMSGYRHREHQVIEQAIMRWKDQNTRLNNIIEQHEAGMILINVLALKTRIRSCAQQCLQQMYRMIPQMLRTQTEDLTTLMSAYHKQIDIKPQNVREFISFYENINTIIEHLDELSARLSEVSVINIIIKNNKNAMGESTESIKNKEKRVTEAQGLLAILRSKINQANMNFNSMRTFFQDEVRLMNPSLVKKVEYLHNKIIRYDLNEARPINQTVQFLQQCLKELNGMFEQAQGLNYYQKNLQMEVTNHKQLEGFSRYFRHLHHLWVLKQKFTVFYDGICEKQFRTLNIHEEETIFEEIYLNSQMYATGSALKDDNLGFSTSEKDQHTAKEFVESLERFSPIMKSLNFLNDRNLKEKQWQQIRIHIADVTGQTDVFVNIEEPTMTVKNLIGRQFQQHCPYFEQITIKAKKQQELNTILKRISSFWLSNNISYTQYKEYKDVYLLQSNEDLYSKIDQCLTQLSLVYESKYFDTVQAQAQKQKRMFSALQDLLEEWFKYQKNWLYMEPLFTNNYFKYYAKELKAFTTADNTWRKIMMKQSKDFSARRWAEHETALQTLRTNNTQLEGLKKMIADFLLKKREAFNRWYFISDYQLIRTLSDFKDIKSLQPHLHTVFQAIERFDFVSAEKDIQRTEAPTSVVSFDGEVLNLKTLRLGSQPEQCLKNLEESIKAGVRTAIKACLSACEKDSFQRKKWIKQHIAQAVHLVDLLQWTKIAQNDYLTPGDSQPADLNDLIMLQILQLTQTAQLLLEAPNRKPLYSLIVQGIAIRDSIQMLRNQNVTSHSDFRWQQQLRLYFVNQVFVARMFQMEIPYSYQFMALGERMVATPETDKSRLKLFQAITQASVVGCGSVELVRDLGYVTGKNFILYDPRYADSKTVLNMIQGATMTGSWLYLSQLDLMSAEYLQQITFFIDAIRLALSTNEQTCYRNLQPYTLSHDFGIFSSLSLSPAPELERAISDRFRQIGPLVVEQSILFDTTLQKYGFSDSSADLTKDLGILVRVCNQYYGRREKVADLRMLARAIGNSGHLHKKGDENAITQQVLSELREELAAYFGVPLHNINRVFVETLSGKYGYQGSSRPTITMKNSENKRNSIVLLEPKGSDYDYYAKSFNSITLIGTLFSNESSKLLQTYKKRNPFDQSLSNYLRLTSPACKDLSVLIGFKSQQFAWQDGILSKFFVNKPGNEKWLVVESPSSSLYTFLASTANNKYLCLPDGQKHELKYSLKVVFLYEEEEWVKMGSPNDQKGVVLRLEPNKETPSDIYTRFFCMEENKCGLDGKQIQYIIDLAEENLDKILQAVRKAVKHQLNEVTDYEIIWCSCLTIRGYLLNESKPLPPINQRGLQKIFAWALFACIYTRLPNKSKCEKMCKAFNQTLKLEHITKVSCLFQYTVVLSVPQGVLKLSNSNIPAIPRELSSQVELIRYHTKAHHPMLLCGPSGSLKSQTISILNSLDFPVSSIIIKVTPSTTLKDFLAKVRENLVVRKVDGDYVLQPSNRKANGELTIFVDDVNNNEDIFEVCKRFGQDGRIWCDREEVYASVSKSVVIHLIVNGKKPYNMSRTQSLAIINFNENSIDIMNNCYKINFSSRLDANLLSGLLENTSSILKSKVPNFTVHDLTKFYRSVLKLETITKELWCRELVEVVTGISQNVNSQEQIKKEICQVLGVDPATITLGLLTTNTIRVYGERKKHTLDQIRKSTKMACLSLEDPEDWKDIIDRKEVSSLCVHLLGFSKNIISNMELIQNLLSAYADSETKDKTIFVMDCDQENYSNLYEKFSSCIDRYFRVLHYPGLSSQDIFEAVSSHIPQEPLAKALTDIYKKLSESTQVKISQETLFELLSDYNTFVSSQTTKTETKLQSLKTCLAKYNEIAALKSQLQTDLKQKQAQLILKTFEETSILQKIRKESINLNNIKKESTQLKETLKQKEDQAKILKAEDKISEAERLSFTCKELQASVEEARGRLDNQSKVVAAEEQTASECKKSKEKYVADIKSIKDKIGNIENLLAVLIPRQASWIQNAKKLQTYLKEELHKQCFRIAVQKHIISKAPLNFRLHLNREIFKEEIVSLNEDKLRAIQVDLSEFIYIRGGRVEAESLVNQLSISEPAKLYIPDKSTTSEQNLVVLIDQTYLKSQDPVTFFKLIPHKRVFFVGWEQSSILEVPEFKHSLIIKLVMELLDPEKYQQYIGVTESVNQCEGAVSRKEQEIISAVCRTDKPLLEDQEIMMSLIGLGNQITARVDNLTQNRETIKKILNEMETQNQEIITLLQNIYEGAKTLYYLNSNYVFSKDLFAGIIKEYLPQSLTHSSPIGILKDKVISCILQCVRPADIHMACFILNSLARGVNPKVFQVIMQGKQQKIQRIDFVPTLGVLKDDHSSLPNITDIILTHQQLYSTYDQPVDKYTLVQNVLLSSLLKPQNIPTLILHNTCPVQPTLKLSCTNLNVIEVACRQERMSVLAELKELATESGVEVFRYIRFQHAEEIVEECSKAKGWYVLQVATDGLKKEVMEAYNRLLATESQFYFLTPDYGYCPETLLRRANKLSARDGLVNTNFVQNLIGYYEELDQQEYNSSTQSQRQVHLIVNLIYSLFSCNFPCLGVLPSNEAHLISSYLCQLLYSQNSRLEQSYGWILHESLRTLLSDPSQHRYLQIAEQLVERLVSFDFLAGYVDEVHTTNLEEEFLKMDLSEVKNTIRDKWSGYGLVYLGINQANLEVVEVDRFRNVIKVMSSFIPQKLELAVKPKVVQPLAVIDKYIQILPEEVKIESTEPFSCEGIEVVVKRDIALFNETLKKLKRILIQLRNQITNSILLNADDQQTLEDLVQDKVPQKFNKDQKINFTAYISRLHDKGKFMSTLESLRFKLRGYHVMNFMDPRSIIMRLIQIERKRLRIQSANPYLKFLNNGVPEGFNINQTSIYLLDLGLECCRYDPLKNCLEQVPDSLSVLKGPTMQLMVAENLPISNNYVNIPIVDRDHRVLMNIDVPLKKGGEVEFSEMRLMIGYD